VTFSILVVEDNKDNQMVISKFLTLLYPDIEITMANNGKEAVDIVCAGAGNLKNKFDIILMDIKMPIMDGFEATRRIKTKFGIVCPYIIALTATVFENDQKKCLDCGMDALLSKPINFQELKKVLSLILVPLPKTLVSNISRPKSCIK
jgi:CheY-like chemotaxis protein